MTRETGLRALSVYGKGCKSLFSYGRVLIEPDISPSSFSYSALPRIAMSPLIQREDAQGVARLEWY